MLYITTNMPSTKTLEIHSKLTRMFDLFPSGEWSYSGIFDTGGTATLNWNGSLVAQEGHVEAFSALMPRWMVAVFLWSPWNSVNTIRPRQDGCYFADGVLKCIFYNENVWISLKISLRFVPKGLINNIPALVQIMAWRRPGDKPLSEPMLLLYSASMS